MELFTMKYEHQKHRMALEICEAQPGCAEVRLGCLAHRKDETTGEVTPDGLVLAGAIPVKELARWAAHKGYLNWQRKDGVPVATTETPATQPAETPVTIETPAETQPAKKPAKTTKDKKPTRTAAERRSRR
jgi:hypothetical protein